MPEFITIDPELEVLLRELAADPESSLLRIPRPKHIRSLFDHGDAVGSREPALSRLEQHLLQVYRSELALLLRQACLFKLVEGHTSKHFVSKYVSIDRHVDVCPPSCLQKDVEVRCTQLGHSSEPFSTGLALLQSCVRAPLDTEPTVSALAAAAFRLERTDDSRLLATSELVQGPNPRGALLLLAEVLSSHPAVSTASSAWTQVGLAFSKLAEYTRSHEAYAHLSNIDNAHLVAWLSRLVLGYQCGNRDDIRYIAGALTDPALLTHPAVLHFVVSSKHLRSVGEWSPTPAARTILADPPVRYGELMRMVVDVLS
jgi:hypothetical protein